MSAAAPSAAPSAQEFLPAAGTQRFRVEGMDCASCARTVEKMVAGLDGVREVQVSFGNATPVVDGDVPADAVQAAVRRVGYTARQPGRRVEDGAPFWRHPSVLAPTGDHGACGDGCGCVYEDEARS